MPLFLLVLAYAAQYVESWKSESGDADEVQAETESLARLVRGLLSRCREKIYLAIPELGETGFEQRGTMLRAFQRVLQEMEM